MPRCIFNLKMYFLTVIIFNLIIVILSAIPGDESCHSYGDGSVYPLGANPETSEHKLQWTKALIAKPAPFWESTAVQNGEFVQLKLTDFLGKYVVFFFYPLDLLSVGIFDKQKNLTKNIVLVLRENFIGAEPVDVIYSVKMLGIVSQFFLENDEIITNTFVCPTEILAFSDRINEFRNINTEVVACSVDSHFTHLAWINTPRTEGGLGKVNIPILSDLDHSISKDYGVYLEDVGHTLRGLFIIDPKGVLRQITMNDLPVGRSVDETLRLVQAFQYTDKHGEVCPAGWKPGQDTIIPNPVEKKKYFEKH